MHEILRHLEAGARVLDLGSGEGSFDPAAYPHVVTVHLDAELPPAGGVSNFVLADAARLPFPNASFDAIVANHSLEHVGDLAATLAEMRRVLRPTSTIYIAVPDASTLNDRVYRWLYRGGGHVNAFRDAATLSQRIALATGRPLVAIRVLHASFIFLHRQNFRSRPPRRLWLFANGDPRFIAALTFALRTFDRWLGTRLSVYGWAMYFGKICEPIETARWTNVCIRCGAAQSAAALRANVRLRRTSLGPRSYICPYCREANLFTPDIDT
jgi:SAM-dependent methyltransferase